MSEMTAIEIDALKEAFKEYLSFYKADRYDIDKMFAAVRAAENEACAQIAGDRAVYRRQETDGDCMAFEIAEAIRKRMKT